VRLVQKARGGNFFETRVHRYARKNLVLVEVDFPSHKPQSAELKEANTALKEKYDVRGYPTLVVLKPDGTVVWKKTGYWPRPAAMIAKLDELNPGCRAVHRDASHRRADRCRAGAMAAPPARQAATRRGFRASSILYAFFRHAGGQKLRGRRFGGGDARFENRARQGDGGVEWENQGIKNELGGGEGEG